MPREVAEKLSGLLARHVKLMFSSARAGPDGGTGGGESEFDAFRITAGVCIDYCIVTRDMHLLFETIYERFVQAKKEVSARIHTNT